MRKSIPVGLFIVLIGLFGCRASRVPVLLDERGQQKAKPKVAAFLDQNSAILAEEGIRVNPIELRTLFQPEILQPFESWSLSVADTSGNDREFILKLFTTEADARSEELNYVRIHAAGLPTTADILWGKAKPYANAHCVLLSRPNGQPLGKTAALRSRDGFDKLQALYMPTMDVLSKMHSLLPDSGAIENYPVNEWLRQMAELGVVRKYWNSEVRDALKGIAKEWKPEQKRLIHGDFSDLQVSIDYEGKVTALLNLERMGFGDPSLDLGYLFADIMVLNPLLSKQRYGIEFPPKVDYPGIAKNLGEYYEKVSGREFTQQTVMNLRVAFFLKIASLVTYQRNDPLLQAGVLRVERMVPALLIADPIDQIFTGD
ncbi:MAG: phosphotransferase [bacterium]|nr:phosphotransferase [bacterium]